MLSAAEQVKEQTDCRSRLIRAAMFLANNVYGKHGGPYQPGTAIGLLFHLLSGGEHELQGFYGHVMGGMGSITAGAGGGGKNNWA